MLKTLAITYIATSVLATLFLMRSPHFDRTQKVFQAAVVWVLPILGAVIISVFHSVVYRNMRTRLQPDRPNPNRKDHIADHTMLD
ncbi:MAG: hypothetical protein QNI99_05130 [Woeseiaceae bacterium]|nr:hypothetical protein [Woeseiaceae bacterium]